MVRLAILRHAPALTGGRLAGRRDVDADCTDLAALRLMRQRIGGLLGAGAATISSPARRCLQTAAALGWDQPPTLAGLWEQDHGIWEGRPYDQLPDLGRLSPTDLARHRPEGGESFDDVSARVQPILRAITCDTLIIAHAGTVRAGLALVAGPAALSFSVAPLSLTVLTRWGTDGRDSDWAIETVNLSVAP